MVIDLIAWAGALLCAVIGWAKGIMKMLGRLIVCCLALAMAFILSPVISQAVYTSLIAPNATQFIDDKIDEIGATETVAVIYAKIQEFSSNATINNIKDTVGSSIDKATGALSGVDIQEITGIDLSKLPDLGDNEIVKWISQFATSIDVSPLEDMLKELPSSDNMTASDVSQGIMSVLEPPIVGFLRNIIFVLVLLSVYLLGNLIWGIIRKVSTDAKPLKMVDRILGGCCGLVLGVAFCLVVGLATYAITSGNTDSVTAQLSNAVAGWVTHTDVASFVQIISHTWCSGAKNVA